MRSYMMEMALGVILAISPGERIEEDQDVLLVSNAADGTVSLLDPASGETLATLRVGDGPRELCVSPNGQVAVVANHGRVSAGSSLSVIDVAARRLIRTIKLEYVPEDGGDPRIYYRPHGIAFLPDGRHVVVTSEGARRLLVVEVLDGVVLSAIDTEQDQSHMVVVSEDGFRAFVTNTISGSVSVIDLVKRKLIDVIGTGGGAQGVALRPGGHDELWVSNVETSSISVIDTYTRREMAEFPCGAYPARLAFTPDGERLLCSNRQAGTISMFDAATMKVLVEIRLGQVSEELAAERPAPIEHAYGRSKLPTTILLSPDGARAFVACTRADEVCEIDIETCRVTRRLLVGAEPGGLAWSHIRGERALGK